MRKLNTSSGSPLRSDPPSPQGEGTRSPRGAVRLDAPTDTAFASARLRNRRQNHHKRASNARPYGIACTFDDNVGATIGRPLLRLGRKFVTVSAHLTPLPMRHPDSARQLRFPPQSRYRADAINVSVLSQGALPLRRADRDQLRSRRKRSLSSGTSARQTVIQCSLFIW